METSNREGFVLGGKLKQRHGQDFVGWRKIILTVRKLNKIIFDMTEDRSKLQLTVNILILCIYHNCIKLEFLF